MKNLNSLLSLIILVTFFLTTSNINAKAIAAQGSIEGVYKTDFGEMTLYRNGSQITGTYKYKGGKISGILNGNTLTGTWIQDNAKGKMVFVFASDFSSFNGKWAYNESAPSSKWNGTQISSFGNSGTSTSTASGSSSSNSLINGTYSTDFKEMNLQINGNRVTGSYKHMGGKIDGVLTGNKLVGTWTQSNGKGKMEFVFNSDFTAFTGKWAYNESVPSSKWNGTKIGGSSSSSSMPLINTPTPQNNLPINISGSWSSGGRINQIGRIHIWQDGDKFVVIASWPGENTETWKSYKGEGKFEGREMNFKVFPSTTDGSSADQGYVYHYTISPDNSEITTYYTRYGKRTTDVDGLYKRVK